MPNGGGSPEPNRVYFKLERPGQPGLFLADINNKGIERPLARKQVAAIPGLLVQNPEQSAQVLFVVSPESNSFVMQRNVLVLFQTVTIPLDV